MVEGIYRLASGKRRVSAQNVLLSLIVVFGSLVDEIILIGIFFNKKTKKLLFSQFFLSIVNRRLYFISWLLVAFFKEKFQRRHLTITCTTSKFLIASVKKYNKIRELTGLHDVKKKRRYRREKGVRDSRYAIFNCIYDMGKNLSLTGVYKIDRKNRSNM